MADTVTLIDIDAIEIPVERLRALQPDKVAEIAASMRDLGRQLQPIMVRLRPGGFHIKKYLLVAGLHRIEARKKNDEKTILATIIDVDAKAAELVEIDENAARADLSATERQELAVKRIANILKANPQKSNRQVAKETKTSHPHVAKVRKKLEQAGDVETVSTSTDTKGRVQPAHKTKDPAVADPTKRAITRTTQPTIDEYGRLSMPERLEPPPNMPKPGDPIKRRRAAGNGVDPASTEPLVSVDIYTSDDELRRVDAWCRDHHLNRHDGMVQLILDGLDIVEAKASADQRKAEAAEAEQPTVPSSTVNPAEIAAVGFESELRSQFEQLQKEARSLVIQLAGAKCQIEELKTKHKFRDVTGKPFLATIVELDMPVVWTPEEIIADIHHPNLTPEHLRRAAELLHYIAEALANRKPEADAAPKPFAEPRRAAAPAEPQ